jgi:hypothetical protein
MQNGIHRSLLSVAGGGSVLGYVVSGGRDRIGHAGAFLLHHKYIKHISLPPF